VAGHSTHDGSFTTERLESWWEGLTPGDQQSALASRDTLTPWMVTSLTKARFKLTQMRWGGPERGVSFDVPAPLRAYLESKRIRVRRREREPHPPLIG
jgi:hypothetical protein